MTPFKEEISKAVVRHIATELHLDEGFVERATDGLDALELKGRVQHVADALFAALPTPWTAALDALSVFEGQDLGGRGLRGWPILHVIEQHGLGHPSESLAAIRRLTSMFSGEFAVRPFLRQDPVGALAVMRAWTQDDSEHVRRLASEGCRPRLPWGGHIRPFQQDPTAVLELLEDLRDDPTEYVRRSVANNLNDISKDHPGRTVEVCARWAQGASKNRLRLVRHALRGLVKAGDLGALAVLGVTEPRVEVLEFTAPGPVAIGDAVSITTELQVDATQKLVVDYRVTFTGKKRARTKVFKWTTRVFDAGRHGLTKRHSLADVSIRTHYPGTHSVALLVNGRQLAEASFEVTAP